MQALDSRGVLKSPDASAWTPPTGTLGRLVEAAFARAAACENQLHALQQQAASMPAPPPFAASLRRDGIAIIAEIKRASPSKGVIAPGLDSVAQAVAYESGGAAAISVLTEPDQFGGSLGDLVAVSKAVRIPLLRKDFIVHPVQIWEARVSGASAVLLIARGLSPALMSSLFAEAHSAGLEVLVEIRDANELQRALELKASIIGVNNRNLETLDIDPLTAPRLIPLIPAACIAIAESGMASVSDAEASQRAGADALLIGSAISASAEPAAAVAAFAKLVRHER